MLLRVAIHQYHHALRVLGAVNTGRRTLLTDTTQGLAKPASYCRDFVRRHDYDSFLVSHFYPKDLQNGFFAVKAFSTELAMIQDQVSTPIVGKMRMQFWRDAIKGISNGSPPRHPIAIALFEAFEHVQTPTYHLKRIVDARDAELHTETHLTVDSLTSLAESTSSTVLYLLLSLMSLRSSTLSHAASHLGAAQTFSTLLRALPFHAKNGRIVIPAEITAKHGVIQEEVLRKGTSATGVDEAVYEFASIANDHLLTAREMFEERGQVPVNAMPIFLSGVTVANYLGRLEKFNFNAFDPRLQTRDWKLAWQIWSSYYKQKF